MPADTGGFCQRPPQTRGRGELIGRRVALEYLPDLEQTDIGKTAVGVFL